MSKIISLSKTRKAKARQNARAQGHANAAKFGRTKADRTLEEARAGRAARDLDNTLRDSTRRDTAARNPTGHQ